LWCIGWHREMSFLEHLVFSSQYNSNSVSYFIHISTGSWKMHASAAVVPQRYTIFPPQK
jgi:hypothetical protein